MDYAVPRAGHAPSIEIEHLETPSRLNPLGARGAGEGGTIPAYAAVACAVEDALRPFGVTIDVVPVTPAMIRRRLTGPRLRPASPARL
jgi:carbon-monoxide dehydrogenase large subunit